MNRFRLLAMILALGMLGVACTSEAGSPSPDETDEPAPTVEPTEEPGDDGTADDGDDDTSVDSNELTALLPTEVDGMSIEYEFTQGLDLSTIDDEAGQELLQRIGGNPSEMSSGFGFGFNEETGEFLTIGAFRIPGADQQTLQTEFAASLQEDDPDQEFTAANVGGKSVLTATDDESGTLYLYARGDILFLVGATTAELAEAALSQLP